MKFGSNLITSSLNNTPAKALIALTAVLIVLEPPTALARASFFKPLTRNVDDLFFLLPALFQIFKGLAGIATVIVAGAFSRGKPEDTKGLARLIAAIGGGWTAYAWFGWPWVTKSVEKAGLWGSTYTTDVTEFSFLRLMGLGFFAFIAVVICTGISDTEGQSQEGVQNEDSAGNPVRGADGDR